ncbi:NADH-quinone oxidoreductase subunit NuoH [Candidatus Leptofilum sp.]|uniref:NADH-quinone oxidoreductase subunit NuoH n=1 Tax=Candidatus Leptofilum sp. TaxID=3241576 RepID=UPI003B5A6AF2
MSFNILEFISSIFDLTAGEYLANVWGTDPWVSIVLDILGILIVATIPLVSVFFVGLAERKVLARMQDRIGPNRVGGKYGLLQMFADVVKMLTKELLVPAGADKPAYFLAPILGLATSALLFAVVPFAPGVIGTDLSIGIFYILAISSVSVVAILLAGWGSNNKYALLGAFRAVAQLVSYEVPMILSLLVPIILARSLSTTQLVEAQAIPFIIFAPISALIFFVSALAETGRSPFDLLEAESEIVAGFHTEYSGMVFGLFMAAEYMAIMFMCFLFSTAFLGGYRFFGLEEIVLANGFQLGRLLGLFISIFKGALVFFVFMWLRATLPRLRIDQLLNFNWKFMVPLTLVILLAVALLDRLVLDLVPGITEGSWVRAAVHLVSNLIIGFAGLEVLRRAARRQRKMHNTASPILAVAENEGDPITVEEEVGPAHDHHHEPVPAH